MHHEKEVFIINDKIIDIFNKLKMNIDNCSSYSTSSSINFSFLCIEASYS